jgi:hypothetical protein
MNSPLDGWTAGWGATGIRTVQYQEEDLLDWMFGQFVPYRVQVLYGTTTESGDG